MCATCECTCPRCMDDVRRRNASVYYCEAFLRACADGNATDAATWKGEGDYQHFNEKVPRADTLAEIAERHVNAQQFHMLFQLALDAARGNLAADRMKDCAETAPFTAGAGASGGSALLRGGTSSHALTPATRHHYAPAPHGGHRLACRCWLCTSDPSVLRRMARAFTAPRRNLRNPRPSPLLPRLLRGAAFAITVAAACVGLLALGAWLDA